MKPSEPMPIARHILTFAQDLSGGGVERAQLRLARAWIEAGRRVTLALGDSSGPLRHDIADGVEVVPLGGRSYARLFAVPRIARQARPDVIFCAGNFYTIVAAWTRIRLGGQGPPIVAKMSNAPDRGDHGMLLDAGHRAWLRLHGRFLNHLVAMTPATAVAAEAALAMPGRVSVIPNPAPPARSPAVVPVRPRRYILGVGRLVAQKRWDRAIDALAALDDREIDLVILGEGNERAALERQAYSLGVAERVQLPGHVDDPMPAMAGAAVLILPSDYEGVPGVLREALSVGTPVVATDSSPSIAEIVTHATLGSIVPREPRAPFVAALARWIRPNAIRPAPVPQPGEDSAVRYLALFDRLVAGP